MVTLPSGGRLTVHERVCDIFVGVLDRRWSYL
jgi:hypothetical protein